MKLRIFQWKKKIETAKSMVHNLDLPMFLWARACCMVDYILNKCPHGVLKDKIPKEAFKGEKHNVSHFKVFRGPGEKRAKLEPFNVDVHVPREKRAKLEPSNLKGILVG